MGHEWAVHLLQENLRNSNSRQAYLITGPDGVGRTTLALRFAQALNCPQPLEPGIPCLNCRSCRQIENRNHPDLHLIQADQVGGVLRVDQIRELQHSLSLAPYENRYRVAVLFRFEEANDSAANALLKTLEEPPPQVVLILTADNAERLLPTIQSRCEVLRLHPLPYQSVQEWLTQSHEVPPDQAALLARVSGGRPGYALRLSQMPERLEKRIVWLDDQREMLQASRVKKFAYAEQQARNKESLRDLLDTWSSLWRDVMLQVTGAGVPVLNIDRTDEIHFLSAQIELNSITILLQTFEQTIELIDRNINPRLAFEILLLDLPRIAPEKVSEGPAL